MKARWSCQGDPDPVALLPASQFFAPNILAIKTGFLRLSNFGAIPNILMIGKTGSKSFGRCI